MKYERDEGSDQKSDIYPHWMAVHPRSKNEFKNAKNVPYSHEMAQIMIQSLRMFGHFYNVFCLFIILSPLGRGSTGFLIFWGANQLTSSYSINV